MTDPQTPPLKTAASRAGEAERLNALREFGLLDTPIEDRFERITRMVCRLLDVPISSFTLIDEHRQWFKSAQGLANRESARDIAFCAHAIRGAGMLIVPDARLDPRFADNPFVTGSPNIVFYVGQPVFASGHCVGTLCAIDHHPRELTLEQQQLLREMAAMVESELRLLGAPGVQNQLMRDLDGYTKRSLMDPVTWIWNDAGAMAILNREWEEAARLNVTLSVIVAELDDLVATVDEATLRSTAQRFISALRSQDACARIDERKFMAILPGCLADQLPGFAQRMLGALSGDQMDLENVAGREGGPPLTASVGGITAIPSHGDTVEDILNKADLALRHAKKAGGDCVNIGVLADPFAATINHYPAAQMSF